MEHAGDQIADSCQSPALVIIESVCGGSFLQRLRQPRQALIIQSAG
jgi:hypothetical protein